MERIEEICDAGFAVGHLMVNAVNAELLDKWDLTETLSHATAEIKQAAETTTRTGQLRGIEQYSASRILFTRFDYTTGDAAGSKSSCRYSGGDCDLPTAARRLPVSSLRGPPLCQNQRDQVLSVGVVN
jgi:hypothetical protein